MAPALGGHRAGAAADEHNQIRLIDDRARLGRAAVGADDADGQRMVFVDRTFAADRGGDRRGQALRELEQLRLGLRHHHAAAADKNRMRCVLQQVTCALDACGVRRDPLGRIAAKAWLAPNFRSLDRAVLHVEGQSDVRRAGPAGGDLFESGAESARHVLCAVEHHVPFRHRTHERALIQLGQSVTAARADRDIAIDAKQRHG